MLEIRVLASSSRGNCYTVSDGQMVLLLECGIPIARIREGLGFRLSQVAACLVSHEHGDHARAAKDVIKAGIDCYMSAGTAQALNLSGHRVHIVPTKEWFRIGQWHVFAFDTVHDAADPLGFFIDAGADRLLYATDTAYLKYRFPGLTHVMIECNYDLDVLKQNTEAGIVNRAVKRRILRSHFNIKNVKEFLRANDLSTVREIWLLHLSNDNSDALRFKREIQELTGKEVRVA